jgi:hypothetical protein
MIYIKTISKPLAYKYELNLVKLLTDKGYYGDLKKSKRSIVNKIISKYNNSHFPHINFKQAMSIRSSYMREKIKKNNSKLEKNRRKIIGNFLLKKNVLKITKQYDIPPMHVIKFYFKSEGYDKKETKDILDLILNKNKTKEAIDKYELEKWEISQIQIANNMDSFIRADNTRTREKAENFENVLGKYLKKHKIKFKTEEELKREQKKKYGKPINTPDFLIKSDLYIDGKKINWIDAKNYYGANTDHINENIENQTKKYIDKFGFGALVFSLGFSQKLRMKNILMLDYRYI